MTNRAYAFAEDQIDQAARDVMAQHKLTYADAVQRVLADPANDMIARIYLGWPKASRRKRAEEPEAAIRKIEEPDLPIKADRKLAELAQRHARDNAIAFSVALDRVMADPENAELVAQVGA